jgi:hypothetical protein
MANWGVAVPAGALTADLKDRQHDLAVTYGRCRGFTMRPTSRESDRRKNGA